MRRSVDRLYHYMQRSGLLLDGQEGESSRSGIKKGGWNSAQPSPANPFSHAAFICLPARTYRIIDGSRTAPAGEIELLEVGLGVFGFIISREFGRFGA